MDLSIPVDGVKLNIRVTVLIETPDGFVFEQGKSGFYVVTKEIDCPDGFYIFSAEELLGLDIRPAVVKSLLLDKSGGCKHIIINGNN